VKAAPHRNHHLKKRQLLRVKKTIACRAFCIQIFVSNGTTIGVLPYMFSSKEEHRKIKGMGASAAHTICWSCAQNYN